MAEAKIHTASQGGKSKTVQKTESSRTQAVKDKNSSFFQIVTPTVSLPKGGGAIKNIDEKFEVNASNGSASFTIPFPSRSVRGFGIELGLSYNSGSGNDIFGLGWSLSLPSIKRKTEKELPEYLDYTDSDIFQFSGVEDLVPKLVYDGAAWQAVIYDSTDGLFSIKEYRPRIEGSFSRIERWMKKDSGIIHWKIVSKENVCTVFGDTILTRKADPSDATKIFEWLPHFSYDDRGNCSIYTYKQEDGVGMDAGQLHNKNRHDGTAPFTNLYPKQVHWGNIKPFDGNTLPAINEFVFEMVFDYGEHDPAQVPFPINRNWKFRDDAFSFYNAGFEIRTCRLCERIFFYHHFAELPGGSALVSAFEFVYDDNGQIGNFRFLKEVITTGFIKHTDGSYTQKSLPPLSFDYQPHEWDKTIQSVPAENLADLPAGINAEYKWIDLYSEGLSGILTEQAGAFYYKQNLGQAHFSRPELINPKPIFSGLGTEVQIEEVEGDGNKYLTSKAGNVKGFYKMNEEGAWEHFRSFEQLPNINFDDPNVRMIDVNGDGKQDILISGDHYFTWYPSLGEKGFDLPRQVVKSFDEEKGPHLVFNDGEESVFISDMNGDGLPDIVSISNGSVGYWPALGHGKFGAKVNMDHAPVFDFPDQFDPKRLRLADIDGSGTTDIIYLSSSRFDVWLNQSGNGFIASPETIDPFPEMTQLSEVHVIDFLGNGTSCIVWSSQEPKHQNEQLKYIDLMKSKKPHLMRAFRNNVGKETELHYTPSTHYYLADKQNGKGWISKLPFPVHCLSKVVKRDRILKTRFASEYSYHHGYYDQFEKEFRGFGRIEQKDAEDIEHFIKESNGALNNTVQANLHQPPVIYISWYHTGAFLDGEKIMDQYADEYFKNPQYPEQKLSGLTMPIDIGTEEWREAVRCCKGRLLRKETYSKDNSAEEIFPYAVEEHNCRISVVQPKGDNRYASFLVMGSESIHYQYDRKPDDPRIAHGFTLETDHFGNVLKSARLVYPRKPASGAQPPHPPEQLKLLTIYSEYDYTNDINTGTDYRLPLIYQSKTYELSGLPLPAESYYTTDEIKTACIGAAMVDYDTALNGTLQKRIVDWSRMLYKSNNGATALAFGILESKALVHQAFSAAFNPSQLSNVLQQKISFVNLSALLTDASKGGYVLADNYFWKPTASVQYDAANFFLPIVYTDPFGGSSTMQYDNAYHLFIEKSKDALNNENSVAGFNYRTLNPYLLKDENDNLSGVRYNEWGIPVSVFVIGKKGIDAGDEFDDTKVEASVNDVPSIKMEYHVSEWYDQYSAAGFDINNYKPKPPYVKTIKRIKHYHADASHVSAEEESYTYFNGSGMAILKKMQAEPGPALQVNANGTVTSVPDTSPNLRWVGAGRTVTNNKDNPVLEYEPYFTTTPVFDDEKSMVELGVTPIIHYDATGRVVKTEYPNKTFSKVEYHPWYEKAFDPNDTVKDSDWYKARIINPDPLIATPEQVSAAQQAAVHYNTPVTSYLDTLARSFLKEADNVSEIISTRLKLDIEGKEEEIRDPMNRIAMRYEYDMLGRVIKQMNMDGGTRWLIMDAADHSLLNWDERNNEFSYEYDVLRRPVKFWVQTGNAAPVMYTRVSYGESIANAAIAKTNNLRGRMHRKYDQSGVFTNVKFDFKGNLSESSKQLTTGYKNVVDWVNTGTVGLDAEIFTSMSTYDALNRPVKIITPHAAAAAACEIIPKYNAAGLFYQVNVKVRGGISDPFVTDVKYNAKGQRAEISYANGTKTKYSYEKETQRLIHLRTTRNPGAVLLQDLYYTYDPAGNITHIKDAAHADVFFDGEQVRAVNEYVYDAVYRLREAKGRKHAGQNDIGSKANLNNNQSFRNHPFINSGTINPNDAQAFRKYTELYKYDKAGNMMEQKHVAKNSSWTRVFEYDGGNNGNNRLTKTSISGDDYIYTYDPHGNMYGLETVINEAWNFMDQFKESDLGGGGSVYYVYDHSGARSRKVIERQGGLIQERIYLSGYEIYRERNGGNTSLERHTLFVMDDQRRIAVVDIPITLPAGNNEQQLTRFQYDNHLGSSSIELDQQAKQISYEEYYPFGTTSFHTIDATREVAAKRYRYLGKERDEESGLNYHGVRYYAAWLCRWTSADPSGIEDGLNLYMYASANPIVLADPSGRSGEETKHVKPFVKSILDKYGIKYAEEVGFEMVTKEGKTISGKFDLVIIDPKTKKHVPIELKGLDPDAFSTEGQKLYIKEFETPKGADIKITGKKGGSLALPKGSSLKVADDSFLRVWKGNMADFADAVATQTGGKKIKHKYFDKDGWKFFDNEADFQKHLKEKGINPVAPSKEAEKAAKEAKDKAEREAALRARKEAEARAKKEAQDKLEKELRDQVIKKGEKKVAKWGAKRLASFVPIGGAVATILLAPEEASAAETGLRAVGSELGVGPLDAELIYDASTFMLEKTGANDLAYKHGARAEEATKGVLGEDAARVVGATVATTKTLSYVLFPPSILIDKIFD